MTRNVLILGGGIPGVVAALECGKLGLSVTLVCSEIELPPAAFRDSAGGWRWFVSEYPVGDIEPVERRELLLKNSRNRMVPPPKESLFGIPSSPLGSDVINAVGTSAALLAYLDRVKPVLTIGKAHHLGALVENRMGSAILNTLVQPLIFERFGVDPDAVDVAVAVPGLNEAITRTGSLSTAVLSQLDTHEQIEQKFEFSQTPEETRLLIGEALEYWGVQVMLKDPSEIDPASETFSHRALVVAGDLSLAQRFIDLRSVGLERTATRLTATVLAQTHAPIGFVTRIVDAQNIPWSVRVEDEIADMKTVSVSRARRITTIDEHRTCVAAFSDEESVIVQQQVSLALGPETAVTFERKNLRCDAAPLTTLEELYAQNRILENLNARTDVIVLSNCLQAGDDSAAIMRAKAEAESLRRNLLGIA